MDFEQLMLLGQQSQLANDNQLALNYRLEAYTIATDDISKGRSARDVGASLDKLGNPIEYAPATVWADEAYGLHDNAVQIDAESKNGQKLALRERAASAMYVGSLALKNAIQQEQAHDDTRDQAGRALDYLNRGLEDIEQHEANQRNVIDQYRVNMSGRVAIGEALYGSRFKAVKLGIKAVGLAALSESAFITPFNLNMPNKDRIKARGLAAIRGCGALATAALSYRPTRKFALRIASRII